jgi:hypothetical protein
MQKLSLYVSRERVVSLSAFGPSITAGRSSSTTTTCCCVLPVQV